MDGIIKDAYRLIVARGRKYKVAGGIYCAYVPELKGYIKIENMDYYLWNLIAKGVKVCDG